MKNELLTRHTPILAEILDDERTALLAAQFDGLEAMHDRKALALAALDIESLTPETVIELGERLDRNQTLIASVSKGLRTALQRIAEVERLEEGKGVYDRKGDRTAVTPSAFPIRRI
jgi:hypothetical protein